MIQVISGAPDLLDDGVDRSSLRIGDTAASRGAHRFGVTVVDDDYDIAYFQRREKTERTLAERALNPEIRDIHLEMAAHYAALASPIRTTRMLQAVRG